MREKNLYSVVETMPLQFDRHNQISNRAFGLSFAVFFCVDLLRVDLAHMLEVF